MGRSIRHWTPRYVYRRILWWHHQRAHPELPWLTPAATALLGQLLRQGDRGVEWGAGRSTWWLARRVCELIAIETDPNWYARVKDRLQQEGIDTVDLRLLPEERPEDELPPEWRELLGELRQQQHDFALIDGAYRDHCALCAADMVRPGGLIVVDNVNRYLPSSSTAPGSVPPDGQPRSPRWAEFADRARDWRSIWTSQGVTDTAIWIRSA